jgi:hypothetical protein
MLTYLWVGVEFENTFGLGRVFWVDLPVEWD